MDDTDLTRQVERAFARFHFDRAVPEARVGRTPRAGRGWVAVGTVVAALVLWTLNAAPSVGRPELALAGWEATPTAPDVALADAASEPCMASGLGVPAMSIVAQDQRGNAATILFAGGGQLSICVVGRDKSGTVVAAATGVSRLETTAKALSVDSGLSEPKTPNFPGLTVIAGRVGQGVSSVEVVREDGVEVTATVASGYFVAWWPTTDKAGTVVGKDESGTQVEVVDSPF